MIPAGSVHKEKVCIKIIPQRGGKDRDDTSWICIETK